MHSITSLVFFRKLKYSTSVSQLQFITIIFIYCTLRFLQSHTKYITLLVQIKIYLAQSTNTRTTIQSSSLSIYFQIKQESRHN